MAGIFFLLDRWASGALSKACGILGIAPNIIMWGIITGLGFVLRAVERLESQSHTNTIICGLVVLVLPHLYASTKEVQPSAAVYHHDVVNCTWWAVLVMTAAAIALDLVDRLDASRVRA
jgi:hypothetical protein